MEITLSLIAFFFAGIYLQSFGAGDLTLLRGKILWGIGLIGLFINIVVHLLV